MAHFLIKLRIFRARYLFFQIGCDRINTKVKEDFVMNYSSNYNTEKFTDEDFRLARDSWRKSLCGDETTNDKSIPGIENILLMYDLDSEAFRREMNRDATSPILFGDSAPTLSGDLKIQYDAIYRMALPYGTVGCKWYKSKELLCDVLFALDWMYDNMYGENLLTDSSFRSWRLYDWWDWYIGGPCPMMHTLMIIEDGIDGELIKKYTTPISYLRYNMKNDPDSLYHMMSRMMSMTPLALLTCDRPLLNQLYCECERLLEIHDEGDNMRRDMCCMTHGLAYNIGYGFVNLDRIGKILRILKPTPLAYPISEEKQYSLMDMIRYTFAPSMYNGRPFAPMNGRKMQTTATVLNPIMYFYYAYGVFGEEEDREIKKIIGRNKTEELRKFLISSFDTGITLEEYRKINSGGDRGKYEPVTRIATYPFYYDALNNSEYESEPYTIGYMWYSGDSCVQFRGGSMVGIRMYSKRAPGYECINAANADGWYTGEGAVYLYTDGAKEEYSPLWWKSADKHLIPGTTIDDRVREPMNFEFGYTNNQSFVGGVALDGEFVTATMDHEAFHNEIAGTEIDNGHGRGWPVLLSTLTSKKSYFMLDGAVACIGCDIDADDGYNVRTVVDNRIFKDDFYIDGKKTDFELGTHLLCGVRTASFGKEVDYHFGDNTRLALHFYEKEGVRRVALWIDHGKNPSGKSYEYIIRPRRLDSDDPFDVSDV